jgi:tRNA threonylcarbamoyladenosine biosynthesis protein TsaB
VILSIDTAGPVIGAACGDRAFSQRIVRGADAVLSPAMAELIEGVDLTAIAVSIGPGAFTGLRVGVAAALGLAVARGVPVVPLGSLEARAAMVQDSRVLALLDGRKGRAYAAFFVDGIRQTEVKDVPPEEAIALASGDWVAVGEGARVWDELILAAGGRIAETATDSPAPAMCRLAEGRDTADPAAIRLRYVRAPDAKKPVVK